MAQVSLDLTIPFPGTHKNWGVLQTLTLSSPSLPNMCFLRDQVKSALLSGSGGGNVVFNQTFIGFDKLYSVIAN